MADVSNAERQAEQAARVAALLPLTPAMFHILLALAAGERHGYGIMLEVEALTGGDVRLGPGTLYRTLQRMQVEELIGESAERGAPEADDERRRYYRVTALGRRVAEREAGRLAVLVKAARGRGLLPGPAAPRGRRRA